MNTKMAMNSQLSTLESKKQTKQASRTETESQIWKSFGGLLAGRGKEKNGEKEQGLRSTNWQVQNRQGDVKNSIGNGKAKELICMTQGHELRRALPEGEEEKREIKNLFEKNNERKLP